MYSQTNLCYCVEAYFFVHCCITYYLPSPSWEYGYTLSQKNDTNVAHYNLNAHQPILVIFGRDIAEGMCY